MNTDENEIQSEQSEQDEPLDETPSDYEPYDGDTLMVDELAEFSAVADQTIQAVDEMYGGVPPIHGDLDSALMMGDAVAQQEAEREFVPTAFEPSLAMPPMAKMRRGQLGSLVPGLLLIGIGAWLTLTTTAGTPPNSLLVAAAAGGAVVLTLLAQWLSTGRWGRGYLFFAVLISLVTAFFAFSLQPGGLSLVRGWPLLIAALGVSIIVSSVLSRPSDQRLLPQGILLVTAGLLGVIVTSNVLPQRILAAIAPWGPAVLIALTVLWLLPFVFRRRG